ncbi:MAG: COQ9 family protein [Stellaceae bacterium]
MDPRQAKDALLAAILPDVPFDGWTDAALTHAAERVGLERGELRGLCPGGSRNLVAWFSRWADRETLRALEGRDLSALKVHQRIAAGVETRLDVLAPHREAVRRALALLTAPQNLALGAKLLYDTVDALWYAAGDNSTDFNFYTKRALLAGVYGATMLYWLDDRSPESADTRAFLDRRLRDVAMIPKASERVRSWTSRLPDPLLFLRLARRR